MGIWAHRRLPFGKRSLDGTIDPVGREKDDNHRPMITPAVGRDDNASRWRRDRESSSPLGVGGLRQIHRRETSSGLK
jgi:hypothetical protein